MRLVYLTTDLLFSSQITAHAGSAGVTCEVVGNADAAIQAAAAGDALVLVDLGLPGLDVSALVYSLRDQSPPPLGIVAYAPHVHAGVLADAEAAGCDQVLTRGQMHSQAEALIEQYAT